MNSNDKNADTAAKPTEKAATPAVSNSTTSAAATAADDDKQTEAAAAGPVAANNADSSIEEEQSYTMLDVLQQEQEMEEEYTAILGASDDRNCTYSRGILKRQALYSCLTCCPKARENLNNCAGICLACAVRCHENHELIELYTKRNFRCDCPTERLGTTNRCLISSGDVTKLPQPRNANNAYNHNFQGLYCVCRRPYPDPEAAENEDEMIQCIICEDWFHVRHLNAPNFITPKIVEMCGEVICGACMDRHTFLRDYTGLALRGVLDGEDDEQNSSAATAEAMPGSSATENVDVKLRNDLDRSISNILNLCESNEEIKDEAKPDDINNKLEEEKQKLVKENDELPTSSSTAKRTTAATLEPQSKRLKLTPSTENAAGVAPCRRLTLPASDYPKGSATFWLIDWRDELCKCESCLELYKREGLSALLDPEDPVKAYEQLGRERQESAGGNTYQRGMRALATLEHGQQIDAILGYNHMKEKLKEYLATFAQSNTVVTKEHIYSFFHKIRDEGNPNN